MRCQEAKRKERLLGTGLFHHIVETCPWPYYIFFQTFFSLLSPFHRCYKISWIPEEVGVSNGPIQFKSARKI